jgi:hypothetical protein
MNCKPGQVCEIVCASEPCTSVADAYLRPISGEPGTVVRDDWIQDRRRSTEFAR